MTACPTCRQPILPPARHCDRAACAEAPDDAVYGTVPEIEPSDKGYKIYVHRPGVRNAHEGGIKFYTQHLPRDSEGKLAVTDAQQSEYAQAPKATA